MFRLQDLRRTRPVHIPTEDTNRVLSGSADFCSEAAENGVVREEGVEISVYRHGDGNRRVRYAGIFGDNAARVASKPLRVKGATICIHTPRNPWHRFEHAQ